MAGRDQVEPVSHFSLGHHGGARGVAFLRKQGSQFLKRLVREPPERRHPGKQFRASLQGNAPIRRSCPGHHGLRRASRALVGNEVIKHRLAAGSSRALFPWHREELRMERLPALMAL